MATKKTKKKQKTKKARKRSAPPRAAGTSRTAKGRPVPSKRAYILQSFAADLERHLAEAQNHLRYDTLKLPDDALEELACLLVDFAADIHAGTGLWLAYEKYNRDLFGTSLPLYADLPVRTARR